MRGIEVARNPIRKCDGVRGLGLFESVNSCINVLEFKTAFTPSNNMINSSCMSTVFANTGLLFSRSNAYLP